MQEDEYEENDMVPPEEEVMERKKKKKRKRSRSVPWLGRQRVLTVGAQLYY